MCSALGDVRFAPDCDRESRHHLGLRVACGPVLRTERRHRVRVPPANASSQHPPQQSPRVVLTPEIRRARPRRPCSPSTVATPTASGRVPCTGSSRRRTPPPPATARPSASSSSARACSGCGAAILIASFRAAPSVIRRPPASCRTPTAAASGSCARPPSRPSATAARAGGELPELPADGWRAPTP